MVLPHPPIVANAAKTLLLDPHPRPVRHVRRRRTYHARADCNTFNPAQIADVLAGRHAAQTRPVAIDHVYRTLAVMLHDTETGNQHAFRRWRPPTGLGRLFQKRHAHTHVRHDSRVFLVNRNAHLHGRLAAVGSRDDRDYVARNLPVLIRIEHRFGRLPGHHSIDVRLIDIDLDLQRIHVDDRADAGAGETAARGKRRDDFADLCGFGDDHALERRAHRAVIELHLRTLHAGPRVFDLLALGFKLRLLRGDLRARDLGRLPRHQLAPDQIVGARQIAPALRELRLELRELCLRDLKLRV